MRNEGEGGGGFGKVANVRYFSGTVVIDGYFIFVV
jgi:hypothetical protein